jgi:hypothetical protein
LEAHTKAIELARYSIRACYNEKIFPMRSRRALANRIVDSVVLIHSNVYKANNTYVTNKDDAEYRLNLQEEAIREIKELPPNIELAYHLFNINGKKIDYWVGLILEEEELLKKWHKSDKARFEKYI